MTSSSTFSSCWTSSRARSSAMLDRSRSSSIVPLAPGEGGGRPRAIMPTFLRRDNPSGHGLSARIFEVIPQKLHRQWIGIDITHLAISLIEKRLNDAFPGLSYQVHGTPRDTDGARALAQADKYEFQWWAVSLVD